MVHSWKSARRIRGWLCIGFVLGGSCLTAQIAAVGSGPSESAVAPQTLEAVTVTGSYLRLQREANPSPMATFDREQIERSGATDALRLLKQVEPGFSGNANTGNEVGNGGAGESHVGLRNLPTLVLVNGRRLANSPILSSLLIQIIPAVDVNNIPLHLVERVEVLKDSASTIYGSDAVGGVVNFILKKNYSGGEFGLRYGSDTKHDYTVREAWLSAGVMRPGWSLTVGAQYFRSAPLLTTHRATAMLDLADLAALGQNPALAPSYISPTFAGRNGNFIIAGSPLAVGAPGYNPAIRTLPPKTNPNAAPLTTNDLVALGYYIPISSTPLSQAVNGVTSILNTAPSNFSIVMSNRREQFTLTAEKEILGSRLRAFGEVLHTYSVNGGNSIAPAPVTGLGAANLTMPANNPYNLFGIPLGLGGPANQPGVRSRLVDFGNRLSRDITRNTRLVFGLRGDIGERWDWETAFGYVRVASQRHMMGGADGVALNRTLIPLLDAAGRYVYDAQGRPLSVHVHRGQNVPVYDWFGVGGTNAPATIEALQTVVLKSSQIDQRSLDFRVTGRPWTLPAGEVALALGGEVRRERLATEVDPLTAAGLAVGYQMTTNFPGRDRSIRAAFLETKIPVVAPGHGLPLLAGVDLTAAIRRERIQPGGNATAPKFGLRWQPFGADLIVRGSYSRGFVAPSIFALYGPPLQNSPSVTVLEGNGQTGAGGSTGRIVTGPFIGKLLERSNPHLAPSRSESHTVGLVYTPSRLPGLRLSADYYHIAQDKVGGFDYAFIAADLNAYGSASIYAPTFRFTDGTALTSTAPNQVTSTNFGQLEVLYNPVGDQWTDGLDAGAEYRFGGDAMGRFAIGANAMVVFNFRARTSPLGQYYQYARNFTDSSVGRGNAQGVIPSYNLRTHLAYTGRRLHAVLRVNHLPPLNAPGTAFGAPPGTPNEQRIDRRPYTVRSYTTADLAVTYALPKTRRAWSDRWTVVAGVNNMFDRDPPLVPGSGGGGGTETNTAKSSYDIIGRFMFLELKKEF